jgi:hypothetical protein
MKSALITMKRILIAVVRVIVALLLQTVGLYLAMGFFPDEPAGFFVSLLGLLAFVPAVAATGVACGLVARRYLLVPAMLLLWLLWMWFIALDQWSDIKLGLGTYWDGVWGWSLHIGLSSAALAIGVTLGIRLSRWLWPEPATSDEARRALRRGVTETLPH